MTETARLEVGDKAPAFSLPDADGKTVATGVSPNQLTRSEDRDWVAGTPWHKHTPARVEAL